MTTIKAVRVGACAEVRALVEVVFTEPSTLEALPEQQRTREWRDEFFQRVMEGEIRVYVPFSVNSVGNVTYPLGIYWADVCGAGAAFVHQVLMEGERRGLTAVLCARACARALLNDVRGVGLLLGLTPADNRAALAVARRTGMRDMGRVVSGGVECRLMAAERTVFEKE